MRNTYETIVESLRFMVICLFTVLCILLKQLVTVENFLSSFEEAQLGISYKSV